MARLKTYFMATRPQFFPGIIVPVVVGAATAWHTSGEFHPFHFLLTVAAAVLYHGGMNVFNDYFDSINGSDDGNTRALAPFTGGSRFIQKGLLTRTQTLALAVILVSAGSVIGAYLAYAAAPLLLAIGAVGLASGYFYTAPPLFLASRGLGELTVGLNFGLLTVLGSYAVQTGTVGVEAVFASLPASFLITALLYINEFPDFEADRDAGKRTMVVRLSPRKARYGIIGIVGCAYISVVAGVTLGYLPALTLLALATAPLAVPGVRGLLANYTGGTALVPSIKSIILTHLSSGVIMALALVFRP